MGDPLTVEQGFVSCFMFFLTTSLKNGLLKARFIVIQFQFVAMSDEHACDAEPQTQRGNPPGQFSNEQSWF